MKTIYHPREVSSVHGTFGPFILDGEALFQIAELPWRGNKPDMSCIPCGDYICHWHNSPHFGMVYRLSGVPNRGEVLIHYGNYAGDTAQGFLTSSHGCLIIGMRRAVIGKQMAVAVSRPAFNEFNRMMATEPFKLIIRGLP